MKLVLTAILIGNLTATSYQSKKEQTDDSPNYTSIGERTHKRGCAVSRDLLKRWGGPLEYGDLVYIEDVGFKFVNDTMNKRHRNAVDVWVESQNEEKKFFRKFRNGKLKVWVIKTRMVHSIWELDNEK